MAIYCRVSTSDQDNDRQERDLREYAERSDFEVVEVFKETLSGIRKAKGKQPVERKRAMELAQRRGIDAVLVTEMTRWGRSTQDLMDTLGQLGSWDVSLIAQTGLTFDLSTPQGKLIANLMASLAEFEHDLLRERVRSGVAAAKARGQRFGRRPGYRPSDRQAGGGPSFGDRETFPARDSGEAGALEDHGQRDPQEEQVHDEGSAFGGLTDDPVPLLPAAPLGTQQYSSRQHRVASQLARGRAVAGRRGRGRRVQVRDPSRVRRLGGRLRSLSRAAIPTYVVWVASESGRRLLMSSSNRP